MDIQEKAHNYAIKALEPNIKMFEQAYLAGYNYAKGIVIDDDIEYIDLGLPSGTLWATRFLGQNEDGTECNRMVYEEALKYSLPTCEQYKELRSLPFAIDGCFMKFFGINGTILTLPKVGHIFRNSLMAFPYIWLADGQIDSNHTIGVGCLDWSHFIEQIFVGAFLPVLLVKQESE